MPQAFCIALSGFTRFEQATFESVFRLAAQRQPAYKLAATLAESDFVLANADSDSAVADIRRHGLLARALMLGATPCRGAGQQLPRPINPTLVLRALDTLVHHGLAPAQPSGDAFDDTVPAALGPARPDLSITAALVAELAGVPAAVPAGGSAFTVSRSLAVPVHAPAPGAEPGAPSQPSAAVQRVLDDLVSATTTLCAGTDTRALAAAAASAIASAADVADADAEADAVSDADAAAAAVPGRPGLDHILIVDGSDVALRFMSEQLQRFGFEVHLARSGTQALERVAKRHFAFVFIDVTMHGIDGLNTCKAIKLQATASGLHSPAPTVVLMTTRSHVADRLRFARAGADACLVKPLREAELLKIVGDREVALHAYAETAAASSTPGTLV